MLKWLLYHKQFGQWRKFYTNFIVCINLIGPRKTKRTGSCSGSSTISAASMRMILENLKSKQTRESTQRNYLGVWHKFNSFLIRLDVRPELWEDRASLFGAYLVQQELQSSTIRSYISAIKRILTDDRYLWDDRKILLTTLTKACKVINDRVKTRLPIRFGLLDILLFEVERKFQNQYYPEIMYKTIFLLSYYGLFRIGELATGAHPVKACNVHIAGNKDKMLFILRTSKTHGEESEPQQIKITASENEEQKFKKNFCPFRISREYLAIRGNYADMEDPFFVFSDNLPVKPYHVRKVLRSVLSSIDLNPSMYDTHSFRIGRASDLVLKYGKSLEQVRLAGRWKSNYVYRYIKNCWSLWISIPDEALDGLEKVWFVGDDFCYHTYRRYFKDNTDEFGDNTSFTFENLEAKGFFSSKESSHNRSPLGRVLNNLIWAINEQKNLLKLILMVLDDDIIRHIKVTSNGSYAFQMGIVLTWLIMEMEKAVNTYKENFPKRQKRNLYHSSCGYCLRRIKILAPPTMQLERKLLLQLRVSLKQKIICHV